MLYPPLLSTYLILLLIALYLNMVSSFPTDMHMRSPVKTVKDSRTNAADLSFPRNHDNNLKEDKLNTMTIEASSVNQKESSSFFYSIFPVLPQEFKKFFSLSFMMFFIVYVFTMTRDTKDVLIVTNCGAESIAFLKVYGVIPAAALFMAAYSSLSNYYSSSQLFYMTLLPFFIFYFIFAFVLYPLRNVLHPMSLIAPTPGLTYVYNLLRFWTFSLYYIMSELWGSAGIPLLFWSCANDVVKIEQAKRIYPLISLIGNTAPIFSGITMSFTSNQIRKYSQNDEIAFETSMKILTGLMMVSGVVIASLHFYTRKLANEEALLDTNQQLLVNPQKQSGTNSSAPSKPKHPKMSLTDSIKVLASSKYLINVATMVLSYGLTIEFTEIIWKAAVKAAFPVKTDYLSFMGRYSTLVGSAAFVMMFVGARVVKLLGWKAGALMTPLMMGLFAAPFFGCLIVKGTSSPTALLAAVYIGLVANVLSKATKYAVFDPTKEMAYIPLDSNSKTKGKAAIDVLGARLGKSGGALVQQILVLSFGNIFNGASIVAVCFYIVIAAWIKSVWELSGQFEKSIHSMEQQEREKKEKSQ